MSPQVMPVPTRMSVADMTPVHMAAAAIAQSLIPQGMAAGIQMAVSEDGRKAVAFAVMMPFQLRNAAGFSAIHHVADGVSSIKFADGSRMRIEFETRGGKLHYYRHDY